MNKKKQVFTVSVKIIQFETPRRQDSYSKYS